MDDFAESFAKKIAEDYRPSNNELTIFSSPDSGEYLFLYHDPSIPKDNCIGFYAWMEIDDS